jgi:hypothetical protein
MATVGPGILNAKAQGRKDAKSFSLLCVFASWRLCVETSKGICPQMTQMDADEESLFFISALICGICGQFRIGLRQAALRFLGLFAAIPRKCLSINNLHPKTSFADQGQSSLIKANRVIL